jgi:hypothetical protein
MIADQTAPPSECPGTAADPRAVPGNLCVYESRNHGNLIAANTNGSFTSAGTWAVTAP